MAGIRDKGSLVINHIFIRGPNQLCAFGIVYRDFSIV